MTTRGRDIFVTFTEFVDWMKILSDESAVAVYFDRGPDAQLEIWRGTNEEFAMASRVFLGLNASNLSATKCKDLNPASIGLVVASVPREIEGSLLLSQWGARSDWWDPKNSEVLENNESIQVYDKVWRRLKKRVFFPVWAKNIVTGGPAKPYRSLGYTAGAKEWFRRGGTLMQEGVANIRFEIRDP